MYRTSQGAEATILLYQYGQELKLLYFRLKDWIGKTSSSSDGLHEYSFVLGVTSVYVDVLFVY